MTDTQVLRRELSRRCIAALENKCQKGRDVEEIERSIITEIVNSIKNEFEGGEK